MSKDDLSPKGDHGWKWPEWMNQPFHNYGPWAPVTIRNRTEANKNEGWKDAYYIQKTENEKLRAENERLRTERDHYRSEYVRLMTAAAPNGFVFVDGRVIGGRDE